MASYSIAQAKDQLPSLIRRVQHGERITITERGTPVAEVGPPASESHRSTLVARRAMLEWLGERRLSRPVSTGSVELLRRMYEDEGR